MQLQVIQNKIYEIRGQKVMLDFDLADLYQVETKVFNQAIKRNIDSFPEDFMFRLTDAEFKTLRSQIVTSTIRGGRRYNPYAFTEHGVTMLASVLKSDIARKMNIAIVRAFIAMRKIAVQYNDILEQIAMLKDKSGSHDVQLNQLYDAIESLLDDKAAEKTWGNREKIGFKTKQQ